MSYENGIKPGPQTSERRGTVVIAGILGLLALSSIVGLLMGAIYAVEQLATLSAVFGSVIAAALAYLQASYNRSRGEAKSGWAVPDAPGDSTATGADDEE
jgi:hypothetical protein